MTDPLLAAARPDGPPQELINRLNETAAFHRPERLDADDAPEYTWREIREITDLLSEAAAALSASRTAQAPQHEDDPIATQINALIKLYGSGEAVIRAMLSASRTDPAVPPQEKVDAVNLVRYLTKRQQEVQHVIEDYPQGGYQHELDIIETLLELVEGSALPSSPAEGHED